MTTYVPPKKNTAWIGYVSLIDALNPGRLRAAPTLAAGDVKISKDGGAFANLTTLPTVTPAASAAVKVSLSATEMNADNVLVVFADQTDPPEWADMAFCLQTAARQIEDLAYPATSGRSLAVDASGVVDANVANWKGAVAPAMTGDAFARIGAAGAGLTALGDTRIANLDVAVSTRLASAGYTAPDNSSIAAIKAKTDNLPADPADASDVAGAFAALQSHGDGAWATATVPTADENADALLDRANGVESGLTPREWFRLGGAALFGKSSGLATSTAKFRNTGDSKDRITATVDSDGNRSSVTLDAT